MSQEARADRGAIERRVLERLEGGKLELPVLSSVAQEVILLAGSDACDMRKLADILRRDPTMAANVLRMANSPVYRGRVAMTSLQQALSRLGLDAVRQVALTVACFSRSFQPRGYADDVAKILQHSLATALYAQEVARARRSSVDEAFSCGLLHDIGRPIVLQAIVDIGDHEKIDFDRTAALEVVTALHERVGAILAKAWELGERAEACILHHHEPARVGDDRALALTLRLADDIAHHGEQDLDAMDEAAIGAHPALAELNLYPDDLRRVLGRTESILGTLGAMA